MDLAIEFIYAIGGAVCHQLPDRSFFVSGRQLPVCARCTGLYLSGLSGVAGWCLWKVARGWRRQVGVPPAAALRLVIVAGLPTAITVVTSMTGIWDGSNVARALLAVPLGVAAGGVVASVFTKDLR